MALFHLRREFGHSVNAKIGRAGSGSQLLLPAGRSFFTSVGKALEASRGKRINRPADPEIRSPDPLGLPRLRVLFRRMINIETLQND